jgi:sulfide dehydrogenase cytochrome subunit
MDGRRPVVSLKSLAGLLCAGIGAGSARWLHAIASIALLPGVAFAAPPIDRQAELWAASCATCHSGDSRGAGAFPALAGRDASELLTLLLRQRAGQADTTIMHQHARGFTEAELARIAAVFAARPKP